MSGAREEVTSTIEQQRAVNIVGAAVSVVAAVFLGGGFYYGMTKQQKALAEEEKNAPKKKKKKCEPKASTAFERRLALDKPLPPSTAARKALMGVTFVSVTGCCLLVGGVAAALGASNLTEFRDRLQKTPAQKENMTKVEFKGLGEAKREILKEVADEVKEEK